MRREHNIDKYHRAVHDTSWGLVPALYRCEQSKTHSLFPFVYRIKHVGDQPVSLCR